MLILNMSACFVVMFLTWKAGMGGSAAPDKNGCKTCEGSNNECVV